MSYELPIAHWATTRRLLAERQKGIRVGTYIRSSVNRKALPEKKLVSRQNLAQVNL